MKRSKRLLSLLLAVLIVLTTVASTSLVSVFAAELSNSALCSEYYATNPGSNVGKKATITIDGSFSDWSADMLIAQGAAWDVANHYKGGHENCVLDTYALYGAWDDQNLYVAWQMVNTTDTWARSGDGPLSDGGRVLDVPLILALRVDPSKTPMSNKNNQGGSIWGQKMGLKFDTPVDHLLYMSGKPGLGEPAIFTAVDAEGNTDYTAGCKLFKAAGIEYKMAEGNICDSIMGLNYSEDPADVTDSAADWVDYKTFKGQSGVHDTKYDSFYEIKIPLSVLGIDSSYLTTNGIGAMLVATRGESALDCIPFDVTMLDNVKDDYASDPSTSHEKDDEDVITVDLARIGKADGGNNDPIKPTDAPIVTEAPTTSAPVVTEAPTTAAPVVTEATTTAAPIATEAPTSDPVDVIEPTEAPVTTEATEATEATELTTAAPETSSAAPTIPVIVPPGFTTEATDATEDDITVPDIDYSDATTIPVIKPTGSVETEEVVLGDADLNDSVSIKDATLIQKCLAKLVTFDDKATFASDVDGSEALNIRDVTVIQKWLAKINVEFAVGEKVTYGEIIVTTAVAEPTTAAPVATTAPVILPPTTAAPVVTEAPTTAAPTEAPTTVAPTEAPVVTEPTEAPVITEPVTDAPVYTEPVYTDPVTEPTNPSGMETIYFVDGTPQGWIGDADAKIYIYNYETSESYAGSMQDENTWTFQVPAGMTAINFYRCEGEFTQAAWNSWTMCVTIRSSENTFTATGNEEGSWTGSSSGGDYIPPVDPPIIDGPVEGDYIYFTDNQGWGTVYCHTWNLDGGTNTPWPGDQMENVGGNQYRLIVDGTHTNLKFNGGQGGPESAEFELVIGQTYSN